MKSPIPKLLSILITGVVLSFTSCKDVDENTSSAPVIGSIDPMADENGVIPVYEGDLITLYGRNLTKIAPITMGETARPVVIVERSESKIVFIVPVLSEVIKQEIYAVNLTVPAESGTILIDRDYYITGQGDKFFVTSATTTGNGATVGSLVTVEGNKLSEVTEITLQETAGSIADLTVDKSTFETQTDSEITFRIPAGNYAAGQNRMNVRVSTADRAETPASILIVTIPEANRMPVQTSVPVLGSSFTITGTRLDMIDSLRIGTFKLIITDKQEGTLTASFPTKIPEQNPVEMSANLIYYYGRPGQPVTLYENFRLNTTYVPPLVPTATSITSNAPGGGFFLNSLASVTGTNLGGVTKVIVGDIEATIGSKTATTLSFALKDTYTYKVATNAMVSVESDEIMYDLGNIKIRPVYYYKGLKLGQLSNNVNRHSENAANASVLALNHGVVISATELFDNNNSIYVNDFPAYKDGVMAKPMKDQAVLNREVITCAADYYAVAPYLYAPTNSAGTVYLSSPGVGSQAFHSYIRVSEGNTFVSRVTDSEYWGTPIILFRVILSNSGEAAWRTAVIEGTIESTLAYNGPLANTSDLALATSTQTEATGRWVKGSVVVAQYMSYEFADRQDGWDTKKNAITASDVYQTGFIHITDVDGLNPETNQAAVDGSGKRSGNITFDLYWPKYTHKD